MTEIWDFEKFGENVALISDTGEKLTCKKLKSRIAEVRI